MNRTGARLVTTALVTLIAFTSAHLLAQTADQPLPLREHPIAPEKNPPGDIPDNQVFLEYRSRLGFVMKVPEGWARQQTSDRATFSDKYNTIALAVSQHSDPLTLINVMQNEISELENSGKAFRVSAVKSVKLPSGSAIVIHYSSNSELNPVTNKVIRLENERYFFW